VVVLLISDVLNGKRENVVVMGIDLLMRGVCIRVKAKIWRGSINWEIEMVCLLEKVKQLICSRRRSQEL
jgi:hypothetical protein